MRYTRDQIYEMDREELIEKLYLAVPCSEIEELMNQLEVKVERTKEDLFLLRTNTPSSVAAIEKAKGRLDAYGHALYMINQACEPPEYE